jgi:hypothetical protein
LSGLKLAPRPSTKRHSAARYAPRAARSVCQSTWAGGPQPRQRRGDPHGAVAQLGPQPGELVELGARQQGVHREAAEGARGLLGEVGGDQGDEPGDVGAGQSLQEVAPTGGVELAAGEVGERPVGDLREVGAAPERVAEQRGLGEQGGVEAGRMVPGGGDRLGLIVEPDPGLEAQLVGVGVKVGAGPQQQLTPREPAMRLVAAAVDGAASRPGSRRPRRGARGAAARCLASSRAPRCRARARSARRHGRQRGRGLRAARDP